MGKEQSSNVKFVIKLSGRPKHSFSIQVSGSVRLKYQVTSEDEIIPSQVIQVSVGDPSCFTIGN